MFVRIQSESNLSLLGCLLVCLTAVAQAGAQVVNAAEVRDAARDAVPSATRPIGIWTSAKELRDKPMTGPAWDAVWKAAHEDTSRPSIGNQSDLSNVRVLAAAIVSARTGDEAFKRKVIKAIDRIVADGKPGGKSLAWAREVGAYVMAADLVDYRTSEFEAWLLNVAHVWKGTDRRTLRLMFETRPNNWGAHAFGSLAAIYVYLGDTNNLDQIRRHWIQGVTGPNPGYKYGRDTSWHADQRRLRFINPKGATKRGLSVDGFVPDDMRRGDSFQNPPQLTNYAWEVQQGLVMAARILERAEMPIWNVDEKALYRAVYALQSRLGGHWQAKGDDRWMLAFYDDAYGTTWSIGLDVWGAGKNTGWAYVLVDNTGEISRKSSADPSVSIKVQTNKGVN